MKFEFVFQFPVWFVIFCLLAGFIYAFFLYRRTGDFQDQAKWVKNVLFGLRFFTVSLIAFFLLAPLLRTVQRELENPVIVILQDNSASILGNKDSSAFLSDYPAQLRMLREQLAADFEIKTYTFSDRLEDSSDMNFRGRETDISTALAETGNLFQNRNVGAVILASDGIYNKGTTPLSFVNILKAPLYTIALGDTAVKQDLILANVNHNQLAYLNNQFPIEVMIQAKKLQGRVSSVQVSHNGTVLASAPVEIKDNNYVLNIPFQLKADKPGIQRYTVSLVPVSGEYTKANNVQDIFIEVMDSRQKILILADAPDPDIAAIRLSLQQNDNYEVQTSLASNFNGSVNSYNLVILHQIPGKTNQADRLISELQNSSIPALYILGSSSSLEQLNNIQSVVKFSGARGASNEATPVYSGDFALFSLSDDVIRMMQNFEPLSVPYANYSLSKSSTAMLSQKIGNVETGYPLLAFGSDGDRKTGVLLGKGIWQWRLHDYAERQNHDRFNEFISKIVQFLSIRQEKKNFRIVAKNAFFENEQVTFEAEVYDASYELVNSPDVLMNIIDNKNNKFPYTFSKVGKAYRLNSGQLPPGDYRYEASVSLGGKVYAASGKFVVKQIISELINTTADHGILQTLASRNAGKMFYPAQMKSLVEAIKSRKDLKPVSHSEIRLKELIHLKWLFFLILTLLSAEWFIRKRNGSY